MKEFRLALRQLRSIWRSGELRVLLAALVLAVGAMSAVGFFSDRIQFALVSHGGLLLGADLLVASDHPITDAFAVEAGRRGLKHVRMLKFPSMVMSGDEGRLAEIKAVGTGYPLRGRLVISDQPYAPARLAPDIPKTGEVWIEPRLASLLGISTGGQITLGVSVFKVSAILKQEPERGGDLFSIAPGLLMNIRDVPATGLIQYGSRVSYRLLVAGDAGAVEGFSAWARSRLEPGARIEDVRNARPEVRSALEKTRQFLGLASMASLMLAMVAMSLAAMRHAQRHLDTCALFRCFGASQGMIVRVFLWQALMLGLLGGGGGCLLGYAAQEVLARLAGNLFLEALPSPTWSPALSGVALGVTVLLGVMLPHLLRLRGVPALRILRRDLDAASSLAWLAWLPACAVLVGLLLWNAKDAKLGGIMLTGLTCLLLAATLLALAAGWLLRGLAGRMGGAWRLGLASLLRRPAIGIAQVVGFSLGLMAMLLLTIVRGDLLASWQASLPADAPNRFVINIQPDQLSAVQSFFAGAHQPPPTVFPMVRGRLVALNGKPMDLAAFKDERARWLAEREFNLSWAAHLQADNRIVAGRWWQGGDRGRPLISMEQGIAESLGIRLGDRLAYEIGGRRIELTVQSLRKVEWDSMRANFFALTPPGVLESFPASYITSFHLRQGQDEMLNRLVKRFPNFTVIDVAAILAQVRSIIDRMAYAVQFVFGFSMLAGVAVLYAALAATRDERLREAALLRVLGASRQQVLAAVLAEFAWIGVLAGVVATVGASVLAWVISERLLHLPYGFNPRLAVTAIGAGSLLVPAAAWLALRGAIKHPPRTVLHSA